MVAGTLLSDVRSRSQARLRALGLLARPLQHVVRDVMDGFALDIEFQPDLGLYVARVEADYPDVLIVDVDLAGGLVTLSPFARSLCPNLKLVAVTCYWSERDEGLREYADAVVHKPPRRNEWEAALDRLGLPRVVTSAFTPGDGQAN
ncbi:MAG: hypothetical protein WD939_02060 [Dehalococcoidia bacterium]